MVPQCTWFKAQQAGRTPGHMGRPTPRPHPTALLPGQQSLRSEQDHQRSCVLRDAHHGNLGAVFYREYTTQDHRHDCAYIYLWSGSVAADDWEND